MLGVTQLADVMLGITQLAAAMPKPTDIGDVTIKHAGG